jgi:hypothetical protein
VKAIIRKLVATKNRFKIRVGKKTFIIIFNKIAILGCTSAIFGGQLSRKVVHNFFIRGTLDIVGTFLAGQKLVKYIKRSKELY